PESHIKESAALEKWLNNRLQANATAQNDLPLTFKDAILGPEAPQWQEAINDELKSLHHNISRYKARLVAKGFTRDRSKRLMTLDQSHLVNQVLKRHGMQDCKPISTPLDPGIKL